MAADVQIKYMLHSFPCLRKDDSRPPGITLGEHVVLWLTEPYRKIGRNVTTDNFFTSVNLAKTLRQEGTALSELSIASEKRFGKKSKK